jgi:hypothetical protein
MVAFGFVGARLALALYRDVLAIRERLDRVELDLTSLGHRARSLADDRAALKTVLRIRGSMPAKPYRPFATEGHNDTLCN